MSEVKATPTTPIPPNNVQDGSDIKERIEQLCCIIQKCGNMIPYNFDGCLTLEQKFIILMQTVQDNMLNQSTLLDTWKEVYEWIDNYFNNLDVQEEINNKLDEIIASGQFEDILNDYFDSVKQQIDDISNKVNGFEQDINRVEESVNNFISKYSLDHVLIVAKTGGDFHTIHEAVESVLSDATINNQYAIVVLPGDYNEQLTYKGVHGINIIGTSREAVILHYNGTYPNCVISMDGDILLKNLTIKLDNEDTYAIHFDCSDSGRQGNMICDNCCVIGGTNAFGIGTGTEYNITIKNCELSCAGEAVVYAHNSPYSNTPNQHLTLINNKIIINDNQYAIRIDDACNSYGNTNSVLYTVFVGNFTTQSGRSKILFRKNTNSSASDTTYMPRGDANIKFDYSSNGNTNIPGINYNEGYYRMDFYFVLPNRPDTAGTYLCSIPVIIDATNYKINLISVTLPGVGNVVANFKATNPQIGCFNIETTTAAYAGQSLSATAILTCP